ncbi:hypothetical protein [uncultured Duncaniella sp.]|uniref:hypothetical protein n=1 Tax=uncultured Duncaniella sp. TaxID=2768039 RepID=UPI00262731DE|nr:hypothetical protein [uncultured Duncaniella sp.]
MDKSTKNPDGVWLLDTATMALTWIGSLPIPEPTVRERIRFALLYIKSKGEGPRFIDCMKRLTKAVAFCLKPGQVAWSGKPYVTTGRSIEEEWANFNLMPCDFPQSGHGSAESLEDSSSN